MFCVTVSIAGDLATGVRHTSLLVSIWNELIVLAFYFVVIWLLTRLRVLTSALEQRVRERTEALTDEMAERERLERELLEISEREHRRIGHDLHDSLGQNLTGAALAAQVLEEKLTAHGMTEAADANRIVEIIEEGIALSRKFAKGLHPIELEAEGLMQALEELAETSSELFEILCHFECDSPVLIRDVATSVHMYRIAQEAVSNAVKHGKARNVVIALETLDDGGVALLIKDDGVGLPVELPKERGMGLRIMAHRASMIGASLTAARRQDSSGTEIACVLHHENRGS
jgi:signal transduction histidine kinase